MTDGVLERTGEVEAHCEQRENESHDTEREKTFGRKASRRDSAERKQAKERNSKGSSKKLLKNKTQQKGESTLYSCLKQHVAA